MIQDFMKNMVTMVMQGGGAKKVAKALTPKTEVSNTQVFFTHFLFSIINYIIRAFIFMIVVNALMDSLKEMNPQLREVTFSESLLFVILFSIIFQ